MEETNLYDLYKSLKEEVEKLKKENNNLISLLKLNFDNCKNDIEKMKIENKEYFKNINNNFCNIQNSRFIHIGKKEDLLLKW